MTTSRQPKPEPRLPLTRERVLDAAIALADEGGIESLSMRKLARALGVEAMSLYNHVANKGDLVDSIVDRVISEIDLPADAGEWDVAIRSCAISAHEALLRHPWACSLAMSATTTRTVRPQRLRYMEWLLRRLREAGFSADLTFHAYHTIDGHIFGFTLWELDHSAAAETIAGGQDFADVAAALFEELRTDYPYLVEHGEQHLAGWNGRPAFDFALDLILEGLERLRHPPA